MKYIDEFKIESEAQRRKGAILLYAYVIGSIAIFFISMPILFWSKIP